MLLKNLELSFGTEKIYDKVDITLKDNDKIGIVGVNGAGKTTLFKVILGKLELDGGRVIVPKNTRIGYLPQVINDEIPNLNISVFEFLLSARPIEKLEDELRDLYLKSSIETDETKINAILNSIGRVQSLLDYWDQYNAENILLKIIAGMNIKDELLDMKLADLSGGQKSKIAFARLLYSKPEIILLDEPTNHLDQESKDYIINYLKKYDGMTMVISHDIEFLNEVTSSTLYLDKVSHQMELFPGNYEKYKKIKTEREEAQLKLLEKQEREEEKLKKIITKYIRGNEKKANIAKDRQKKLEKLEKEKVVIEKKYKNSNFKMQIDHPSGVTPVCVKKLNFGYTSDNVIIKNLTFDLSRGEKFLIVGENGVGKSTLLKLIMEKLVPLSGEIIINDKVDIGYYAQEHEILNNDLSIIDNFKDSGLLLPELRSILGCFLFHGDDINKKINVLSPGERSRVALAKIAVLKANLLLLDEPTNHLDPETQKIIADTFKNYSGTMLVVSHNVEFVDNLGIERILLLPSGQIKYYDKNIVLHYQELNQNNVK